ncbi:unnamed protein product, partial [Urochloa humidicola]
LFPPWAVGRGWLPGSRLRSARPLRLYIYPRRAAAMAPHPQHKPFYSTNTSNKAPSISHQKNMSDKCGSCDCADKSQCTKKGDSYGVVMPDTSSRSRALRWRR